MNPPTVMPVLFMPITQLCSVLSVRSLAVAPVPRGFSQLLNGILFLGAGRSFVLHACAVQCCDFNGSNMSASMVRATVRAVSKRKILATRAALTLVSYKPWFWTHINYVRSVFVNSESVALTPPAVIQRKWWLNTMLRDPKLANQTA